MHQEKDFEGRLVEPRKLNILRALLLGSFSRNLLVAKEKKKDKDSKALNEEERRTIVFTHLPAQNEEEVKMMLKEFGTIEQVGGGGSRIIPLLLYASHLLLLPATPLKVCPAFVQLMPAKLFVIWLRW